MEHRKLVTPIATPLFPSDFGFIKEQDDIDYLFRGQQRNRIFLFWIVFIIVLR